MCGTRLPPGLLLLLLLLLLLPAGREGGGPLDSECVFLWPARARARARVGRDSITGVIRALWRPTSGEARATSHWVLGGLRKQGLKAWARAA
jgi:hypothetical protein